jgi:uncharacterized protein YbaA (DUF1428 family)
MSYLDGFVIPLPKGKEDEYRKMAETFAKKAKAQGAIGSVEALGDGLEHGRITDFFRAVKAEDNENVVFSFILWPSKEIRDTAWKTLMAIACAVVLADHAPVLRDCAEGAAWFGVSGLPTVILNEKLSLVGAVPTERYHLLIDWFLAGEPGGVIPLADAPGSPAGQTPVEAR